MIFRSFLRIIFAVIGLSFKNKSERKMIMLTLTTILGIDAGELIKYKIHFAIGDKSNNKIEPLIAFRNGTFKEWQESQNKKNFEREYIISLIYYKAHQWLFGGVYKSNGCKRKGQKYFYDTTLIENQKDLIGRVIIKYKKLFRQSYPLLETCFAELIVGEILDKPSMIDEFPGYNNVNIDYEVLKTIVNTQESTWKNALSIMKGIYLITDKSNGKHYVGSATGEDRLWNRWSNYVNNGHGNNTSLREIIENNSIEYAKNFKFSILEIAGMNIAEDLILQREAFWKEILLSKEFGYNNN